MSREGRLIRMIPTSEPGAITPEHIETVRKVRAYIANAEQRKFAAAPSVVMLAELLECYDLLAARVAWIVASHEEACDA